MGFEVYQGKSSQYPRHGGPSMSVSERRTQLVLNRQARDALGTPTHVVLLHDGARIALRAAIDVDRPRTCYALSQSGGVSARAYIVDHDVKPGLYPGHVESGLLVFDPASAWLDEQQP